LSDRTDIELRASMRRSTRIEQRANVDSRGDQCGSGEITKATVDGNEAVSSGANALLASLTDASFPIKI